MASWNEVRFGWSGMVMPGDDGVGEEEKMVACLEK
jgi:hypothetical protein